jgi:acetoin utilization deacetylase AcuC-like enzyme
VKGCSLGIAVGVIRDSRYLEHKPGIVHPESPNRLRSIYRMLDRDFPNRLIEIGAEPATLEHLELVHTPDYIRQILRTAEREFTSLAPDTPVSSRSYLAAWLAVGGCIKGVDCVMSGRCRVCFCLVRPPGHHALVDRAGGFCIFNNLGVAARYAMATYGLDRVLIVDWDIHHGNALQDLFYGEAGVLYFSTHYMGWYPHTGSWEETGTGEGEGYTVNVPVFKELEDPDMIHVYREILVPMVRRFQPQLIMVAAGFDAHHRDPLGRTRLTEKCFRWLAQLVLQLSDSVNSAPILLSLEGGYDNFALAASVREVLAVLAQEGRRERIPAVTTAKAGQLVEKARRVHAQYGIWTP